jgi:glycosyltransferase involved in cell wall biosynthesis
VKVNTLPLVTVVTPYYNNSDTLERTITSIKKQSYKNIEHIIVNDGSTANHVKILKTIQSDVKEIFHQSNCGQASARNKGIAAAEGEYVVNLDSDDYFEEDFISQAVDLARSDRSIKVVGCHSWVVDHNFQKQYIAKYNGGYRADYLFVNNTPGSLLFEKARCMEIGGYDENMREGFEDWEFALRMTSEKYRAAVINEPLLRYTRDDRRPSTTTEANKIRTDLWQYIFLKHKKLYKNEFGNLLKFYSKQIKDRDRRLFKLSNGLAIKCVDKLKSLKRMFF